MKKVIILIICFMFVPVNFTNGCSFFVRAEGNEQTASVELDSEILRQLETLDFSEIENSFAGLNAEEKSFFQSASFTDKLQNIIAGKYSQPSSFLSAIITLAFDDLLGLVPLIASIIGISILCGFVSSLRSSNNGKSVADIVHFVCYGMIIILISVAIKDCVNLAKNTIALLTHQMQAIFPILLTLTLALGGGVTVSIFQPTMALVCNVVSVLLVNFVLPIFTFSMVISVLSNMTNTVKLDKFSSFFSSLFKWTVGIIFTVFSAYISIQGISAGKFDGISYKTAKYTVKNAVPFVGGYISDGFDLIAGSSAIIKNAVGVSGLFLLASTIIVPLVKIIVFSLSLKLTASILQPLGDNLTSNFVSSVSRGIPMLVAMILGVSFMYLLSVGIVISTGSVI